MIALLCVDFIAQEDSPWGSWVYLLFFIVLPFLKSLGEKLRKKFGPKTPDSDTELADPQQTRQHRPVPPDTVRQLRPSQTLEPQRAPSRTPPMTARPVAAGRVRRARPAQQRPSPSVQPQRSKRAARTKPAKPKTRPLAPEIHSIDLTMQQDDAERQAREHQTKRRRPLLPKHLDTSELRRAIILSEILQPPLALRDSDMSTTAYSEKP